MSESLIVIPLDGSELSEGTLPYASTMAKVMEASLLLLTVWEAGERTLISSVPDVAEDIFKRGEEHWEGYLADLAKKLTAQGLNVEAEVRIGDPADEILYVLDEREPRLLIAATHGRSGLGRWRYGSVTSKLAREAPVPTMIVGPAALESATSEPAIRRILVPLDGSPLAESALQPALEFAEALDAKLILAQALNWASQAFIYGVPDANVAQIDLELTKAGEEYLSGLAEGLPEERTTETAVLHGPPADALLSLVESESVDLVVMASHTRSGLARIMLGSVADRMLQGKAPVLLVRPEEVASVVRSTRGRYCHTCGRASAYIKLLPDDRCRRCSQRLHTCANCVYFTGVACLLQRSEVQDTYPGQQCPYFQFRETDGPAAAMAEIQASD